MQVLCIDIRLYFLYNYLCKVGIFIPLYRGIFFCYNSYMDNLEKVLQIISIIVFISGGLTFFFKSGSYKANIDTKLQSLDEDVKENKKDIEELREDFDKMKKDQSVETSRLETLLIEVKTKLELLMQFSGLFNKDERN